MNTNVQQKIALRNKTIVVLAGLLALLFLCFCVLLFHSPYAIRDIKKTPSTTKKNTKESSKKQTIFNRHFLFAREIQQQLQKRNTPVSFLKKVDSALHFCKEYKRQEKEYIQSYGKTLESLVAHDFPFRVVEQENMKTVFSELPKKITEDFLMLPSMVFPAPTKLKFIGKDDPGNNTVIVTRIIALLLLNNIATFSKKQTGLHFIATCHHIQFVQTHKLKIVAELIMGETEKWRMYIDGLRYLDAQGLSKTLQKKIEKIRSLYKEKYAKFKFEQAKASTELMYDCPSLDHVLGKPTRKGEYYIRCFDTLIASYFQILQEEYKEQGRRKQAEFHLIGTLYLSRINGNNCECDEKKDSKPAKESTL